MKELLNKSRPKGVSYLLLSILLVFCVLGTVVYGISMEISRKMSEAAIQNVSESLDLLQCTIEAILNSETEFQSLIAQELAEAEDPEAFILGYRRNRMMSKISIIPAGQDRGVSNDGAVFTEEGLDFSAGGDVAGMPVSQAYINYMGTWAYTVKCPILRGEESLGTLYAEYIYDAIDQSLPDSFFNHQATLYIMDAESTRFVLKPTGMGQRDAGHLNLEDFYQANDISDPEIWAEVDRCIAEGTNALFYHDIRGVAALNYLWEVNGGTVFLAGYVPVSAIQREGQRVNQSVALVALSMLIAFFLCILLYYRSWRQQDKLRREREAERNLHNRQLSEALRAAQIASESKTMFLSNMSHDIRTPMNAVLGFATLLSRDAEDPRRVREYTGKIQASGQHLLSLINDILDVSKIESGKVVLNYAPFSLRDMIASVEAIIQPMAAGRHQAFQLELRDLRHELLVGDETRINQILINLLSNAVKYTQEGGTITLRFLGQKQRSSQYDALRIEVEDNGYGMTPEYLEHLFDAFTRAENSTTNKVQGTGLGMAITKNLVELMGGTIQVSSEVDKGTLFQVDLELRIPEEREAAAAHAHDVEEAESAELEGLHFLAAEDNEINAEILRELLELEGASCDIVENGRLAVERFQAAPPGTYDAILMDVQMPVMNGHDATRAIRALAREDAGTIPVIAMTANAFTEDERAALAAGMNAHVAKPLDMEQLRQAIHYCKNEKESS